MKNKFNWLKNLIEKYKRKRLKKKIKKFIENPKIHCYSDVINWIYNDPVNTVCDLIVEIERETGKHRVWDWKV